MFNLISFLTSLSTALDFVEMDYLGVTSNHSKRVAYIAIQIGKELGLKDTELLDLIAFSMLHDNGSAKVNEENLYKTFKTRNQMETVYYHCITGEENIRDYPFFHSYENVIRYHHENYNGKGYFGIKGEDIPLFSQIIHFADIIDNQFNLREVTSYNKRDIIQYIQRKTEVLFSKSIVSSFINAQENVYFWLDLKDHLIIQALERVSPFSHLKLSWQDIEKISKVYRNIIDSKSSFTKRHSIDLSNKVDIMCRYYQKDEIETIKLKIAADLHDIGKLAISNDILEKPGKLTKEEFEEIKKHTYYTRICLENVEKFEDITEWASNHHEFITGDGYPYKKSGIELDFNSRLLSCLDKYVAITENRPYREGRSHDYAINVLRELAEANKIDKTIVEDIANVFK